MDDASISSQIDSIDESINNVDNNTSGLSDQMHGTQEMILEIEQKQDQNFEQLKEIAKQLGLTEEGEEAKIPFYEIITEIKSSDEKEIIAMNSTNEQLTKLNQNLTEVIQESSQDYSEQFTDLGTLLSYTNILLLVLIVFVLFGIGIKAGGMVTSWLKTR